MTYFGMGYPATNVLEIYMFSQHFVSQYRKFISPFCMNYFRIYPQQFSEMND